jgi:thioredoxin reductase (NADPH)
MPVELVMPQASTEEIAVSQRMRDLIIIGGGPAGLTAGIYAGRSRLDVLLLEGRSLGGQAATTDLMENYPGFPDGISGIELASRMEQQARKFGLAIVTDEASSVTWEQDQTFVTTTLGGKRFPSRAVIAAMGAEYRRLGIPGEDEFTGRGVSYCATCDGPFFKDRSIAVIGGGESAVTEALYLTRFAREIHLIHRRDQLRAAKILKERILNHPALRFHWNSLAQEIRGADLVEALLIRNVLTGEPSEIPLQGVFIFAGLVPRTGILRGLVQLDEQGYIIANSRMQTSVPGLFAAGDVRQKPLRQVSTAISDGALAAFAAEKYLENR